MSELNLPKSWSTAVQDEVVACLREDTHLAPIADAIVGRAADDVLEEMRRGIEDHGIGIYVWSARLAALYSEVKGLTLPQALELQIDVRESSHYNKTGASAYAIADHIIDILHNSDLTVRADGRRSRVVGDKEQLIQSEIAEMPGLNFSVETVSIFFTVYPRRAGA